MFLSAVWTLILTAPIHCQSIHCWDSDAMLHFCKLFLYLRYVMYYHKNHLYTNTYHDQKDVIMFVISTSYIYIYCIYEVWLLLAIAQHAQPVKLCKWGGINSWQKRKLTFQFNLATLEQPDELSSELNTGLSARERENIHGVIAHAEQSGQECHKLQQKWGTEELNHLSNTQPLTHTPYSILNRSFSPKTTTLTLTTFQTLSFVFNRKKTSMWVWNIYIYSVLH